MKIKVLKLLILFVLVFFIFQKIEIKKIFEIFNDIDLRYLIFTIFLCFIFPLINAKKWQLLTDHNNSYNFKHHLKTIILSKTGSDLTGVSVIGEIIKIFRLKNKNKIDGIKMIIIDKYVSIKSKIYISLPIIYIYISEDKELVQYLNIYLFAILFLFVSTILLIKFYKIFVLSILQNILIVSCYWSIIKFLNIDLEIIICFVFLIIEFITQIISIWGGRELLSIYILQSFDISGEKSLLMSFIFTTSNIIILPFYIFYTNNILKK